MLKPDAFVRVAAEGCEYLWFVEVDRGAESRLPLKQVPALRRLLDFWTGGQP